MEQTILAHLDFVFLAKPIHRFNIEQHCHPLAASVQYSDFSTCRLCCRGHQSCKKEQSYAGLVVSLQSTAVELEMKWVKEI